ncbi:hypothetical protein CAOG_07775 [Capsaspora owczarzaki ATCC 30864]|uniref:Dolichol-phosphate mannosyltransferase subunit 3 n=1 Tax=Capsaspora owczarzaki (strain ATCC 30864) TaxID=595528 RepID=A0A0D2WXW4_CAPO3|nr:hypothetical protein CAOG_07775 [Capsaspora owczarzaki ATCC 30864]KJE97668.1 hypothetical protein CAOG_007775 [Capsaspora owczarzaki ATCC 30864]|eukprot:XP_004342848.1 hypothetical protein CAOG_07775 [Capsaspora owczarzaki ATCC 30864]
MATKLQQFTLVFGFVSAVWTVFLLNLQPAALKPSPAVSQIIPALPFVALVAFCAYSLMAIGYRLATFNDCNEASQELQQEVKLARADLSAKGFKF